MSGGADPDRMTDLDLYRASLRGELAPEAEQAFAARVASDGELAAALEDFAAVDRWIQDTLPDLDVQPEAPPHLRALPRRRSWIRFAAAAVVLVAIGLAIVLMDDGSSAEGAVRLEAIALALPDTTPVLPEMPASLSTYASVVDGRIQWLDDLDRARAVARLANRPTLMVGTTGDCSECEALMRALEGEGLRALIALTVPVRLDMSATPDRVENLRAAGAWPYVALSRPDSGAIGVLSGGVSPHTIRLQLEALVAVMEGAVLPWPRVQAIAGAVAAARGDGGEDALGRAFTVFEDLHSDASREDLVALAKAGLRSLSVRATRSLLEVRDVASTDGAPEAMRLLRRLREQFSGTPYEIDFERVLTHVERFDAFPRLEPAGD